MLQFLINGVIAASVYALAGLGFVLHYRVAKFFDFSYAISFVIAPYACWGLLKCFENRTGMAFWACSMAGIVCTIMFALLLEVSLFQRLRSRSSGVLIPLLVSLGAYIVVQNTISRIDEGGRASRWRLSMR